MRPFPSTRRGRPLAGPAAVLLAASLTFSVASCGIGTRQDGNASATSATSDTAASGSPTPAATPAPTPTPSVTPGKGPACAAVRCTSVLVTGDMLVHAQLWEQARADALATGAKGLDFGPLLEGQRKYLEKGDLAICHQETPVAGPTGPFSAYPSFNVPPQIVTAAQQVGYQACTTASNHTIDQGTKGLVRTLDALDAAGLQHSGSYRTEADSQGVLILQTAAAKIALIEGTYGLNGQVPDAAW